MAMCYNIDLNILYFFNHTIAAPWLDPVMIALTSVQYWMPVYIVIIVLLLYYKRMLGVRVILATMLLVAVSDSFVNKIIKPAVARPRPCAVAVGSAHAVSWIRLPNGGRFGDSFPSSHAVNNFAGVVFFIVLYPKRKKLYWLLLPAFLIAITRPYLGLHYPSDVLGGILIGSAIGYCWARGFSAIERRFFESNAQPIRR